MTDMPEANWTDADWVAGWLNENADVDGLWYQNQDLKLGTKIAAAFIRQRKELGEAVMGAMKEVEPRSEDNPKDPGAVYFNIGCEAMFSAVRAELKKRNAI